MRTAIALSLLLAACAQPSAQWQPCSYVEEAGTSFLVLQGTCPSGFICRRGRMANYCAQLCGEVAVDDRLDPRRDAAGDVPDGGCVPDGPGGAPCDAGPRFSYETYPGCSAERTTCDNNSCAVTDVVCSLDQQCPSGTRCHPGGVCEP